MYEESEAIDLARSADEAAAAAAAEQAVAAAASEQQQRQQELSVAPALAVACSALNA